MIGQLSGFVLECSDPKALALFYAELTGAPVGDTAEDGGWCSLTLHDGLDLSFQRSVEYRAPRWPDPHGSMQFHLHLRVADLDMAQLAIELLGGTVLAHQPSPEDFRVLADPAGHLFCLVPAR